MGINLIKADTAPVVQSVAAKVGAAAKIKRKSGHIIPRPYLGSLDQPGRLRIANLLVLMNISDTEFYNRLNAGAIPKPDGTDPRKYWNTETVRAFLEKKS